MSLVKRRSVQLLLFLLLLLMVVAGEKVYRLYQAIQPNPIHSWQVSDESNQETIDHHLWQQILARYLVEHKRERRFDYQAVSTEERQKLTQYLHDLQQIDPRDYRRDEQLAYWINLYNALTIDVVLSHYPIHSIKEIGDGLTGPWNIPLAEIAGTSVTLNQIEHGILRGLWQEKRIHYVINCASLGCPDLPTAPFSADNIEQQLDQAATRFIQQSKAVRFEQGELVLSSIYNWFSEDFGNEEQLLEHLQSYANPELRVELKNYSGKINFAYDWKLNAADSGL